MNQKEIFKYMDRFQNSSIGVMKIKDGDFVLLLEKERDCPCALPPQAAVYAAQANVPARIAVGAAASGVEAATGVAPAGITGAAGTGGGFEKGKIAETRELIKAPIVGVFYAASAPDQQPFVSEGTKIKKGQVIGLLEAMKIINELKASTDGIVKSILVSNGDTVEYDQVLFEVEPC